MPTQHQILIEYLRSHPEGITTADYMRHPILGAEFRSRVSEARKKGFNIECHKIKKNLFRYFLVSTPDGELALT